MPSLSDYKAPSHTTTHTELNFNIETFDRVALTATHKIEPNQVAGDKSVFQLDGEAIDLHNISIRIPGTQDEWRALTEAEYLVEVLTNQKGEPTEGTTLTLNHLPEVPFELRLESHINTKDNTTAHGLYQSGELLTTHCESVGFRRIAYSQDRSDVLATYHVTIESEDTPAYKELRANGNFISEEKIPSSAADHPGRKKVTWDDPFPKPSYLFACVNGPLFGLDEKITLSNGQEVTIQLRVEEKYKDDLKYAMEKIVAALQWQDEVLGLPYDLDTYQIIGVDDFNAGAMENKGLNIFNVRYLASGDFSVDRILEFIISVTTHENNHNYFGNRVTIRSPHELWLKEGLATLTERLFVLHHTKSKVPRMDEVIDMLTRQFRENAGSSAKPVRPQSYEDSNELYTSTTYSKGAEVHYMLLKLLGWDDWLKGINYYLKTCDGTAATSEQYIECMLNASGRYDDLIQFARWFSEPKTPDVAFDGTYDPIAKTYTLKVTQENLESENALLFPLQMALLDSKGQALDLQLQQEQAPQGKERMLHVNQKEQSFVFTNVTERPVPSLLRDFSAPLNVTRSPLTQADKIHLLRYDSDPISKLLVMRQQMSSELKRMMESCEKGESPNLNPALLTVINDIMLDDRLSADERMSLICLPSMSELFAEVQRVDPLVYQAAKQRMNFDIAQHCSEVAQSILVKYQGDAIREYCPKAKADLQLHFPDYEGVPNSYTRNNAGIRQMVAWATSMYQYDLALDPDFIDAARNESSSNRVDLAQMCRLMSASALEYSNENVTSHLAGLSHLLNPPSAIVSYLSRSHTIELVSAQLDLIQTELFHSAGHAQTYLNWLSQLGGYQSPMVYDLIRLVALSDEPGDGNIFDMTNPNMARGLIRALTSNPMYHDSSGLGYKLLTDYVIALDAKNAEVAATVVGSLTNDWHKMSSPWRELMYHQILELNKQEGLSIGVLNKVNKALEKAKELIASDGLQAYPPTESPQMSAVDQLSIDASIQFLSPTASREVSEKLLRFIDIMGKQSAGDMAVARGFEQPAQFDLLIQQKSSAKVHQDTPAASSNLRHTWV